MDPSTHAGLTVLLLHDNATSARQRHWPLQMLEALTAPPIEPWAIAREAALATLEVHLQQNARAVVVSEPAGFGKTIFATQAAQKYAGRCIALFVNRDDTLQCTPDFLQYDVYHQAHYIVHGTYPASQSLPSNGVLQQALVGLAVWARRARQQILFVLDGWHELEAGDDVLRSAILDVLPLQTPQFQFLITTTPEHAPPISGRIAPRSLSMQVFGRDETRRVLAPFILEDQDVAIAHSLTQGLPWKVGSLRRLLEGGEQLGAILGENPSGGNTWWRLEWRAVDERNALELDVLALRAFDSTIATVGDIARVLGARSDEVQAICERLTFLTVSTAGDVAFRVEAFRRFVAQRLAPRKDRIYTRIIADLVSSPDRAAKADLPAILERAERDDELMATLSPEHFGEMFAVSQSLATIHDRAQMGVNAALRKGRTAEVIRFGLHAAVITSSERGDVWRLEVDARLAVRDYIGATLVAQNTLTLEHRLHLLALVAKQRKQDGLPADAELEVALRALFERLDLTKLGSYAYEIAADLFHVAPDAAIRMVDAAAQRVKGVASPDWAFASMTLANALSKVGNDRDRTDDDLEAKISDQAARRFASEIRIVLEGRTAPEALAIAGRIADPADRLYLLRKWLAINAEREDAIDVALQAMQLAIGAGVSAISSDLLADVSRVLPYAATDERSVELVRLVDAQLPSAGLRGRSVEALRARFCLAEAEARRDFDSGATRFEEAFYIAADTPNVIARAEGFAILLNVLARTPLAERLESRIKLKTSAISHLRSDMQLVLEGTAYHYMISAPVLRELASENPLLAEEFALQLNTESRRQLAIRDLAVRRIEEAEACPAPATISRLLGRLTGESHRARVLTALTARLQRDEGISLARLLTYKPILEEIARGDDPNRRARSTAALIGALQRRGVESDPWVLALQAQLIESWSAIDATWVRVATGLRIVRELADSAPKFAGSFFDKIEGFMRAAPIRSRAMSLAYVWIVGLTGRAFEGLLHHAVAHGHPLAALSALIDRIPSTTGQAQIWGDIALACERQNRRDLLHEIVVSRVRPSLAAIPSADRLARQSAIVQCAPALYFDHHGLAEEAIDVLESGARNSAYANICHALLTGFGRDEPFEGEVSRKAKCSWDSAVDITTILAKSTDEVDIWATITHLAEAVLDAKNRNAMSGEQLVDIAGRLKVIAARLPFADGIQHAGPRTVALAGIAAIERAGRPVWDKLVADAKSIGNTADRAFVLTRIAKVLPRREGTMRGELLAIAIDDMAAIPAALDRLERLLGFATDFMERDGSLATKAIRLAMESTRDVDPDKVSEAQDRILDAAHQVDEALVPVLVAAMDTDPSRQEARRTEQHALRNSAKQRAQVLTIKKALGNPRDLQDEVQDTDVKTAASACERALAALNAGHRKAVALDAGARSLLAQVASGPVDVAYWPYAWAIGNAVQRDPSTDARKQAEEMFEALLRAAEVAWQIGARSNAGANPPRGASDVGELIDAGDRDRAFQLIRRWLEENPSATLLVCDQYFGPDDLDLVALLHAIMPDATITLLTGRRRQLSEGAPSEWPEIYSRAWRALSDQAPPVCEVVVFGDTENGDCPVHDRWIIGDDSALSLGTSSNSLGRNKLSQINILDAAQRQSALAGLTPYISRSLRFHERRRLEYSLFELKR